MKQIIYRCDQCNIIQEENGELKPHLILGKNNGVSGIVVKSEKLAPQTPQNAYNPYIQAYNQQYDDGSSTALGDPNVEVISFEDKNYLLHFCDPACMNKFFENQWALAKMKMLKS